jgi:hypothetical protein
MYNDYITESLLKIFGATRKTILSFDEDEQREVDKELAKIKDEFENKEFTDEVIEQMERGYAAEALSRLAQDKMNSGSFEEAAYSCVKSLALFPFYGRVWLLLAEICANVYGEAGIKRNMEYIKQAKYVHNQFKESYKELPKPFGIDLNKSWEDEVKKTTDFIKSKKKS